MTEQVIDGQFIVEAQLYCSRHHRRLGKVFSEYVSHQLQTSIQFRYTNEQHSLLSPTPRATALCDNDVLLFVRSIVCHLSFFLLWAGTRSLSMQALRPASQAGPMRNPRALCDNDVLLFVCLLVCHLSPVKSVKSFITRAAPDIILY